jgi:hypothetical protein
MDYIFAEELTPFKKGEILSDTDPRLGDSSDPKFISSPESILKHIQKLTQLTGLKPIPVNVKSKK